MQFINKCLLIKSENSLISKICALVTDSTRIVELTSSVLCDRKLIMTTELQYYEKLRANLKLNKSENLLI